MGCIYSHKGKVIGDFLELLEYLDKVDINEFNDISDIIFSTNDKLLGLKKQLDTLKANYLKLYKEEEAINSRTDSKYEDELGNPNGVSAQEILDDPRCIIDGERIIKPYDEEAFINAEVNNKMEKNHLSEDKKEEVIAEVMKELENNEKIRETSVVMHKLIDNGFIRGNTTDFINNVQDKVKGTVFELSSNELLKDLSKQMHIFLSNLKAGVGKDAQIVSNLGIKAEAFGINIFGHIDYITIDDQGKMSMYVFKASTNPYNKWSSEKLEKYYYHLAFLKQMLKQNGVDVQNMELNIVPILLRFNDDFSALNSFKIANPENISVTSTGNSVMDKYEKHAAFFIKSAPKVISVSNEEFAKARELCTFIAPNANIQEDGLHKSVEILIKEAPESGEAEPYTISRLSEGNWRITIGDKEYITKSTKPKNSNEELRKIFEEHINELADNKQQTVTTLKNVITNMAKENNPDLFSKISRNKGLKTNASFIYNALYKYISDYDERDGKKTFRWKIIDDLLDYNIVLILNLYTDQLDVLVLSPYHTNAEIDFHNGTHTILGRYRRDIDVHGILRNTYGNLESLRGILLLNQWLPKIGKQTKLGNITVLSYLGSSQTLSIADVTRNHLPKIFEVVLDENSEINMNNNFIDLDSSRYIDPIKIIENEFERITSGCTEEEKSEFANGTFLALFAAQDENDTTAKIVALKNLLTYYSTLPEMIGLSPDRIIATAKSDKYNSLNCRLYITIELALNYYQGTTPEYEGHLNSIDALASTTTHVGSRNIRIITENAAITFNSISDNVEQWHSAHIRDFVRAFQKSKGYDVLRNATIGDELSIYLNLYEEDDNGVRTMRFKNPFTDGTLDPNEKTFLKNALWTFYLIRNNFLDSRKLGGPNSEEFEKFVFSHADMLWVPLTRANSSTKVYLNFLKKTWAGRFKRMILVFKDPRRRYYEFVENISEFERLMYEEDREQLTLRNPFEWLGRDLLARKAFILLEGIEFFETNVDNLLVEYLYQKVKTLKLNDYLVTAKALIVEMELMGEAAGIGNTFKNLLDYIQDFLKVNVYDNSIKNEFGRAITGILTPLRTLATLINLGGNIVSFFRDIFQGLLENFIRTFTKLNTDLEAKYIKDAYAYVVTHGITNTMNIDMLSKLQTKYRLSNIDLASSESLKLGRGGVINYKNWAYSTLRRPDFLNRMTLFVARCMLDGVWDAYSIVNDLLVYDWKKDKRFSALVDGTSKDSDEYKKAKALYMSKIRDWNEEHPLQQLPYFPESEDLNLPTPYSNKEILAIKGLADNIYGAYDKVHKSMMEHGTIMWFFGMYTTWMNGIWSNYFMKPGNYSNTKLNMVQDTNESGKPLFWTEDFKLVTTDTGMPVYKNIPSITQGVWYTLKDIYYIINDSENGGWKKAYEFYSANPLTKANMRKLISDMLVCLLMFVLLKGFVLEPAYKDYKKEMKNNPVVVNLLAEVFYKSTTRSWDSFLGPWNYMSWLFENNDSPVYEVNTKIMKDAAKVIYGDKSLQDAVINNFAFARIGKDTYRAWKQANK